MSKVKKNVLRLFNKGAVCCIKESGKKRAVKYMDIFNPVSDF